MLPRSLCHSVQVTFDIEEDNDIYIILCLFVVTPSAVAKAAKDFAGHIGWSTVTQSHLGMI